MARPDLFLIADRLTPTNASLLAAFRRIGVRAEWLPSGSVERRLRPGDVALARFDVTCGLDGVEPGIWMARRAERRGVRMLNGTDALLLSHDKLATAFALRRLGLPHPRTAQVGDPTDRPPVSFPLVVKPRFGSWGRDVVRCESAGEYRRCLQGLSTRSWFRRHGALVQELVPPRGFDVRIVVASGRVVGAVERRAGAPEWRTNVALGASRVPTKPDDDAVELALDAARAVRGDFVGIDLLPAPEGGYTVLEVNGAVDFTEDYSLDGGSVFESAARALSSDLRLPLGMAASAER